MKKLTIKEILEMSADELEIMMTEEEFDRMRNLDLEYSWKLLDLLQEGARLSGLEEDEEYITINEYLEYLENMKV